MPEIVLILHNIRSTHNVGSIFRTAEGLGVSKIILSGYTPYPTLPSDTRLPHIREKLTAQIHKTALGAEQMVPFEYTDTLDLGTLALAARQRRFGRPRRRFGRGNSRRERHTESRQNISGALLLIPRCSEDRDGLSVHRG